MDLAAVRRALCAYVSDALADLNCYPYPDPQAEYPAMVIDALDDVTFHATTGCDGAIVQFTVLLLVADPDPNTSVEQLESLIGVGLLLEAATDPSFVNIVSTRFANVRSFDNGQAIAGDLTVTVHV